VSSVQAILRKLSELAPADRQWVLGRLPAEHKRKLLDAQDSSSVEAKRSVEVADSFVIIDRASAQTIHNLLATEPAWFSAAVIGSNAWSWRDEYFRLLSEVDRRDLQISLQSSSSLTDAMKGALIEAVASRVQTAFASSPSQEPRFESMLQKLAAKRSRRRWSGAA
jgi:hypothetical protein